jgi:ubiquinone/menaquinone biosynthesis C-methylase UbiE
MQLSNRYEDEWFEGLNEDVIASFAGTGNPFSMGMPTDGEYVIDVGSGAGLDTSIAARAVGPAGHVIGVDMTDAMLEKARKGAESLGYDQLEFRQGYAESLPVPDGWADLVISNGTLNLTPDKSIVYAEVFRTLRPGGRIQMSDITVQRPISDEARHDIDLWTN